MARLNGIIDRFERGEKVFGTFLAPEAGAAAAVRDAGYDTVLFETEHKPWDPPGLKDALQYLLDRRQIHRADGLAPAVTPLVRIPPNGEERSQWHAKQALDLGAYGVLWPHVDTVEAARNAVASCRYPRLGRDEREPVGVRGDSPAWAARYWGISTDEYYRRADVWPLAPEGEVLVGLMIESVQAVEQLDTILTQVPGIGLVMVGEGDLTQELGLPRQYEHPTVLAHKERILQVCAAHGVAVGHPHVTEKNVDEVLDHGYRLLLTAPVVSHPVWSADDRGPASDPTIRNENAEDPMYIDSHAHFTTAPDALKQWRDRQIIEIEQHGRHLTSDGLEIADEEISRALTDGQLRLQAEHSIDVALLSPIAGRMAHHYGDQETSLTWTRLSNDTVHRACTLFPRNFVGVAQLPQSPGASIDACVEELRRSVTELGFVGCNLNPDPSDGQWKAPAITDRYYYPLYEEMVRLGVPAMIHASMSANPAVHGTCAHYLNGDTTAFMQLCQSDLFRDFPDLKLIIPHGGGAVPYHWGRYQGVMYDQGRGDLIDIIGDNVYFDTCVYYQRGLQLLVDTVPVNNVLFASEMIGAVRGVNPESGRRYDDTRWLVESLDGLNRADRAAIAHRNALTVFPRLREALERNGVIVAVDNESFALPGAIN